MKQRLVFTALMSFSLAIIMTCWVTWLNLGFVEDFFFRWGKAFVMAWPVAATVAFVLGPRIMKISMRFK